MAFTARPLRNERPTTSLPIKNIVSANRIISLISFDLSGIPYFFRNICWKIDVFDNQFDIFGLPAVRGHHLDAFIYHFRYTDVLGLIIFDEDSHVSDSGGRRVVAEGWNLRLSGLDVFDSCSECGGGVGNCIVEGFGRSSVTHCEVEGCARRSIPGIDRRTYREEERREYERPEEWIRV